MLAQVIVALDVPDRAGIDALLSSLPPSEVWVKIGYEAYYAHGSALIDHCVAAGFEVMLDLKLHDIPRTVAAGVERLVRPGVKLLTMHAQGGCDMMQAAVEAAAARADALGISQPAFFAVTMLTSLDPLDLPELGILGGMGEQVARLAGLARNAGCTGVVCSAHEVAQLKQWFGRDFQALCPGIRAANAARDDQQRVATVAEAVRAGAEYLVIGRPITQAADPGRAVAAILEELRTAERSIV